MKRILCLILVLLISVGMFAGCTPAAKPITPVVTQRVEPTATLEPTEESKAILYEIPGKVLTDDEIDIEIEKILKLMSLTDKAYQMVQGKRESVPPKSIKEYGIGSVLSGGGSYPGESTIKDWREHITMLQDNAMARPVQIPIIYGIDAMHGNDHILDSVIFPHNIGIGVANDPELTREMGRLVAEQVKVSMVNWNFAPCIAVGIDPRWGRTYESISTDPELVTNLSLAYLNGLQGAGMVGTAKHYLGDGGTVYGTGDHGYRIDRGDVKMTEEEIRELFLPSYKALVDAGVYTVMASYSSINGLKMHENSYWINDVLKGELGFKGMVVSDWEGTYEINGNGFADKTIKAVNAGIDLLMEPSNWKLAAYTIVAAADNGDITSQRIDDAVRRILWVKFKAGLFENPYPETDFIVGADETKIVATKLVEKSAVLIKNNNDILPIKEGMTVLLTGPAMDNIGVQCGGWTEKWQGDMDGDEEITAGITLLEGLEELAPSKNITIITDTSLIDQVDVVMVALGEIPYAEGSGDSVDLTLLGTKSLTGSSEALEFATNSGKPVVTIIIAGRNIMISDYIDNWDAGVMAYLPGTEGNGLANVLLGDAPFTGKLPMPWYNTLDDIEKENPQYLFELGFGIVTD